ncbi:MAG TPA: iron-sulfur cluster repair di-iron protein [Verrucomicrobiota bacterium]|nr:iron-sulfur cluster repair di-iron protein [Verrucomicrobiota bacterium]HNT14759.1 iron-sulfur cluster repair di-iron protein [Verrucomicrobiota bacterium]
MLNVTAETTIGDIVRTAPATSRLFDSLKIDFCCGGKKSLAESCKERGLDVNTVVTMLSAIGQMDAAPATDVDGMTLTELCNHIQETHHAYLREELSRLDFMTRKVLAVHGEHEPRLIELRKVFEGFQAEMTTHTDEEDESVFPAICELEVGDAAERTSKLDLVSTLKKMENEHDSAGQALEKFHDLTDNFTAPDWACNTFRALYDALKQLDANTHQHIHKENNVLFPKARQQLAARPQPVPATT